MNDGIFRWSRCIIAGLLLASMVLFTAGFADLTSNSSLDLTFNKPNGYALWHTPDASQDQNLGMAVQKDGKIIVSGDTNDTKQNRIQAIRYLTNGSPDSSFGNSGQFTFTGERGKDVNAHGIVLDSNENILLTGEEHNGDDSDLLLLRCTPDGSPDSSFGDNGTVRYPGDGPGKSSGRGVVVQTDGKIVVCGEVTDSSQKKMAVLRYTPDGILDPDFGSQGIFTLGNMSDGDSYGLDTAMDSNGKILVTGAVSTGGSIGNGLIRLNRNGTIDTSFGNNGLAIMNGSEGGPDYGNHVTVTSDGKILVTGVETDSSGSFDIVLLRYTPDGALDTEFGVDGVARFGYSGKNYAWGQTGMPDGRIILAGTSLVNLLETPVLIAFTKDGNPDTSFGKNGMLSYETIGIGPLHAVQTDDEGKILACGYIVEDGIDLGLLLRMNPG